MNHTHRGPERGVRAQHRQPQSARADIPVLADPFHHPTATGNGPQRGTQGPLSGCPSRHTRGKEET
jgi:hypothetical protein